MHTLVPGLIAVSDGSPFLIVQTVKILRGPSSNEKWAVNPVRTTALPQTKVSARCRELGLARGSDDVRVDA
jgi:hypothetical protein